MSYPKYLTNGLPEKDKERIIQVVTSGGYKYNQYGEVCLSEEDDDGVDYSRYCTPEEIEAATKRMKLLREDVI